MIPLILAASTHRTQVYRQVYNEPLVHISLDGNAKAQYAAVWNAFPVFYDDFLLKAQNIALFVVKWILIVIFAQKAQDNA